MQAPSPQLQLEPLRCMCGQVYASWGGPDAVEGSACSNHAWPVLAVEVLLWIVSVGPSTIGWNSLQYTHGGQYHIECIACCAEQVHNLLRSCKPLTTWNGTCECVLQI